MENVGILMEYDAQNIKVLRNAPEQWNRRLGDFTEIAAILSILANYEL